MSQKTVVLVGTLDTKGAEYGYLRDRLILGGVKTLLVDVGTLEPPLVEPDISRRAASLGTENAFVVLAEVNALAREGKDIISFCIGQPDFPAPDNIQEAAIRAIRAGKHGYTPSAGIDELREAAARYMSAMRGGLPIRPQDVVVGPKTTYRGAGGREHVDIPLPELAGLAEILRRRGLEDEEEVIRGMQEHFGLGRLAASTRERFEAALAAAVVSVPSETR